MVDNFRGLAEQTLILFRLLSLVEAAYYVETEAAPFLYLLILLRCLVFQLAWVLVDCQCFGLMLF